MVITPAQLVDEPLKLDEVISEGAIEYAPDIRQIGPLSLKGQAELIVEHRGPKEFVQDIRLRAGLRAGSSSYVRGAWSRWRCRWRVRLT